MLRANFCSMFGKSSICLQKGRPGHSVILAILMVYETAYDNIKSKRIGAICVKKFYDRSSSQSGAM